MSTEATARPSAAFGALNLGWLAEQYQRYLERPDAVDPDTRKVLAALEPELRAWLEGSAAPAAAPAPAPDDLARLYRARELARRLRTDGHLWARFNPLDPSPPTDPLAELDPAVLAWPARLVWPEEAGADESVGDRLRRLRAVWADRVGYEFGAVRSDAERGWLVEQVETTGDPVAALDPDTRRHTLRRLVEVGAFERFLHRTFPGQKRFSVEGTDVLVPMLDDLIHQAARAGFDTVALGMAHRGRLAVLAHVLGKPLADILAEFHTAHDPGLAPSEGSPGISFGWTGDVKYHLGASALVEEPEATIRVVLAHNPSHLEFVDPVVEGIARAAQDDRRRPGRPEHRPDRALPVLVHGDAAFAGEGIAAETLNLAELPAYTTGGTVHILLNNQIGFTTPPEEGRSTRYASDLALGFHVPVIHVSADDPDRCLWAVRLAFRYRQRFHRDVFIDLVGYRRWGHNEGDDPAPTQPTLYDRIRSHPPVADLYRDRLLREGLVAPADLEAWSRAAEDRLKAAYEEARTRTGLPEPKPRTAPRSPGPPPPVADLARALLAPPSEVTPHPRVARLWERRREELEQAHRVDWGTAEALAFATLLRAGVAVRLTGQDTERGTFGQRHLVWHDVETEATACPLDRIPGRTASFLVQNSPLSEAACIGFEYGYATEAADALVLWEAQYGDFANAGQVLIDQFVAAGGAKWQQDAALVLLLPHGYEGQGPEHSSARLERFLELAAAENWTVAQPTTAAQYYHLLREQGLMGFGRRPLVVMTPKSLLRHPLAESSLADLEAGGFAPLLGDPPAALADKIRIVLTSGKLGVELAEARERDAEAARRVGLVRVERLYPFPTAELAALLARAPAAQELVWAQEEPENMGAWTWIRAHLEQVAGGRLTVSHVARPASPAPAEGFSELYVPAQQRVVHRALGFGGAAAPATGTKEGVERTDEGDPGAGTGRVDRRSRGRHVAQAAGRTGARRRGGRRAGDGQGEPRGHGG